MAAVNLVTVTTITRITGYQGSPGTGLGTLYTVPASTNAKVVSIVMSNATTANATVTLNVVPNAGTASVSTQIMSAMNIAPNASVTWDTPIFMGTGDVISGLQGTASAISVLISVETYA